MTVTQLQHIANTYYNPVRQYCLSRVGHNEALADDLAQEVFLFLQQKYTQINADENIKGWLFAVAGNKIKEAYRDKKKQGKIIPIDNVSDQCAEYPDILLAMENQVADDEIETEKESVLQNLSPKEQELYTMVYVENLSSAQIAAIYATSVNAIRLRTTRLRRRLRQLAGQTFTEPSNR